MAQQFESLGVEPRLLHGLRDMGYLETFPIQAEAVEPLLKGRDVVGQAHTGSGKTIAFALPMLQRIEPHARGIQGVVLVPTRELAVQVANEFERLARHLPSRTVPIYGGQSIRVQIEKLHDPATKIIAATPGRLLDHLERGTVDLRGTRFVVLDEADRMLDMGFIDDVKRILDTIQGDHQTALFSATMPEEVVRLSHRYLSNPLRVFVDDDEIAVDSLNQHYVRAEESRKFPILLGILKRERMDGGLIFCSTKIRADRLARGLWANGYNAQALHGDLSQNQRDRATFAFRQGKVDFLVATDVAARGLDIPWVSHVINYDMPEDPLMYFHRVGRTARAGRKGESISLVSHVDDDVFRRIKSMTSTGIVEDQRLAEVDSETKSPPPNMPPRPNGMGMRGRGGGNRPRRNFNRGRRFRSRRR